MWMISGRISQQSPQRVEQKLKHSLRSSTIHPSRQILHPDYFTAKSNITFMTYCSILASFGWRFVTLNFSMSELISIVNTTDRLTCASEQATKTLKSAEGETRSQTVGWAGPIVVPLLHLWDWGYQNEESALTFMLNPLSGSSEGGGKGSIS